MLPIPDEYARTDQLKIRYQLGPTDGLNNYSGWNIDDVYLTGEFEVDTPDGMGGTPGNPNPPQAFSGVKILGTDVTGLGAFPYHYEPGLSEATSYRATSPTIDVKYYKNLNLFYKRYFNIEVWDQSSIQVSTDNGSTWNTFWQNSTYLSDFNGYRKCCPSRMNMPERIS